MNEHLCIPANLASSRRARKKQAKVLITSWQIQPSIVGISPVHIVVGMNIIFGWLILF